MHKQMNDSNINNSTYSTCKAVVNNPKPYPTHSPLTLSPLLLLLPMTVIYT